MFAADALVRDQIEHSAKEWAHVHRSHGEGCYYDRFFLIGGLDVQNDHRWY